MYIPPEQNRGYKQGEFQLNDLCCPRCGGDLKKDFYHGKVCYKCRSCGGVSVAVAMIRQLSRNREFANFLWRKALQSGTSHLYCPFCRKPMRQIIQEIDESCALELDICCNCQLVWFDGGELETIPLLLPKAKNELPQKAQEILALEKVKNMQETISVDAEPANPWLVIPAVFGFPVELNAPKVRSLPLVTWGFAVICIFVFAIHFYDADAVKQWGLIPNDLWRNGGLNIFTSVFFHGNWVHLIGNIYFLLIFGDNVEDHLGKWRYVLFLLMSQFFSFIIYLTVHSESAIPCIGASGVISGIIALYAVLFPKVRLSFLLTSRRILLWRLWHWISLPAWAVFVLWMIFQSIMAFVAEVDRAGGVAYSAHIGGALFGLFAGTFLVLSKKTD